MTTADPKYTKLGCGLFAWPPYVNLGRESRDAAHLWLVLYAGAPSRLLMPGLWMGGIGTMADVARMSHLETLDALQRIETHELAEFDPRAQVLRLTKLPDRCDRAPNGSCLRSWWERRRSVPDCGVRDRHLELMAWLHLPIGSSKGAVKLEMQRAWDETFGSALNTVPAPLPPKALQNTNGQAPSQEQLDLYAAPVQPHGDPHGGGHRLAEVMVKVTAEEEGEVQERGTESDPAVARFRLLELDGPREPPPDLWAAARARMAARVSAQNFAMWVEPVLGTTEGDTLRLTAPTDYHRKWFRDHYASELEDDLLTITGRAMRVAI